VVVTLKSGSSGDEKERKFPWESCPVANSVSSPIHINRKQAQGQEDVEIEKMDAFD
jgi:hypothetical protein